MYKQLAAFAAAACGVQAWRRGPEKHFRFAGGHRHPRGRPPPGLHVLARAGPALRAAGARQPEGPHAAVDRAVRQPAQASLCLPAEFGIMTTVK